jgi:hypothetical protein
MPGGPKATGNFLIAKVKSTTQKVFPDPAGKSHEDRNYVYEDKQSLVSC